MLGCDHLATLVAAAGLASALAGLGELERARALGEDSLERCRRVLGPDHPATLVAAVGLTRALGRLGEVDSARALAEDTLQRSRRALGPDHPITRYLAQLAVTDHPPLGHGAAEDNPDPPQ